MSAYNNIDRAILGLKADASESLVVSMAAQEAISFGETVWGYLGEEDKCYGYHLDTAKIVFDADFEASNSAVITVDGDAWDAVVYATSHDNTMDLLIAEGTAQGYEVSLDATDTDNRTIYIAKATAGTDVGTVTEAVTGGSGQPDGTITYQSDQVFLGVALYIAKDVSSATSPVGYSQYESVGIFQKGRIWAAINGTILSEDTLYCIAAATNGGVFTATSTSNLTVNVKAKSNNVTDATTSDTMAIVEVDGSYKPNAQIAWV